MPTEVLRAELDDEALTELGRLQGELQGKVACLLGNLTNAGAEG